VRTNKHDIGRDCSRKLLISEGLAGAGQSLSTVGNKHRENKIKCGIG
jgi:hypothetical protein